MDKIYEQVDRVLDAWNKLEKLATALAKKEGIDLPDAFRRILQDARFKNLVAIIVPTKEEEKSMTMSSKKYATIQSKQQAGNELDRLVRQHMSQHGTSYWESFRQVKNNPENEDIVREYAVPENCRFEE